MKKIILKNIKDYRFKSLLMRNLGYVILGIVFPLLFIVCRNYARFEQELNRRLVYMNDEILYRSAVVVENIVIDTKNILEELSAREEILYIVENESMPSIESIQVAVDYANEYVYQNAYIGKVYIYSDINGVLIDNQYTFNPHEEVEKGKWYYVYEKFDTKKIYVLVNNQNSVFVCQQLFAEDGRRSGVVVLDLQLQKIRSVLENKNVLQKGCFLVVDVTGRILYCSQEDFCILSSNNRQDYANMIIEQINDKVNPGINKNGKIVSIVESENQSWKYVLVSSMDEYEEELKQNKDFIYESIILALFMCVVVACCITYTAYQPIRKIIDVIENPLAYVEDAETSKQTSELMYITGNILNTISLKKNMEKELKSRMNSLNHAKSEVLRFQMNPHFLYNTLETIKWCSIEEFGAGNKTAKAVTKLSRLYRFCLSDESMVTLKEELSFTKSYIEVLRIMFGEKIQYEWNVDEKFYSYNIIKMCIQPVIENAVNHGLKEKGYYGIIEISVFANNAGLHLVVEDNGVGLTEGEIMVINQRMKEREILQGYGVGLRNINERIKLIYGEEYGVSVSKTEKHKAGLKVDITVPSVVEEE